MESHEIIERIEAEKMNEGTATDFVLSTNASPITWKEAKEDILRFHKKMEEDGAKFTEPLVYVFPVGSMLNLLEEAKENKYYTKVFGKYDESSRGLFVNLQGEKQKGRIKDVGKNVDGPYFQEDAVASDESGDTKEALISIGAYFFKDKTDPSLQGKRPITHLKFYNAIEIDGGKERRKIIIAAATTERDSLTESGSPHEPKMVQVTENSYGTQLCPFITERAAMMAMMGGGGIQDQSHQHEHPETIEEISPLNWGTNCPPWCDMESELEFLQQ